jgi:hypothetical protein
MEAFAPARCFPVPIALSRRGGISRGLSAIPLILAEATLPSVPLTASPFASLKDIRPRHRFAAA